MTWTATERPSLPIPWSSFLSCQDWDAKARDARQRLDSLTDQGAPAISLAEVLTVPHAEAVLQSLRSNQEYAQRGQFYTAMEEAYTAILCAPDYLPMHRRVADMLWESGRQEDAVAKYLIIADTYQSRGDSRHATTIYQRILRLMPMDVQTRSKLIDLLLSHGEMDKAIEQHMALADTYYQTGRCGQGARNVPGHHELCAAPLPTASAGHNRFSTKSATLICSALIGGVPFRTMSKSRHRPG